MSLKFFAPVLLSFLFAAVASASAAAPAAKKHAAAANARSEAWTGVITYTRTHTQTDTKTLERVSGRGKDTRNWEMNFDYKATVGVVEAPEKNGTSVGKASISHSFTSKE